MFPSLCPMYFYFLLCLSQCCPHISRSESLHGLLGTRSEGFEADLSGRPHAVAPRPVCLGRALQTGTRAHAMMWTILLVCNFKINGFPEIPGRFNREEGKAPTSEEPLGSCLSTCSCFQYPAPGEVCVLSPRAPSPPGRHFLRDEAPGGAEVLPRPPWPPAKWNWGLHFFTPCHPGYRSGSPSDQPLNGTRMLIFHLPELSTVNVRKGIYGVVLACFQHC